MPETTPVSVAPEEATIQTPEAASAVDMTLPAGEKMLAIIGYIGFLCVLPLALKPKSEMCQHHGKQALAITLLFSIASGTFLTLTLLAGTVAFLYKLTALFTIAWAAVAIMGMLAAAAGKKTSLPFFGSVAKKFNW